MTSLLDHQSNFATNEDRQPRTKADRIRIMGRAEKRTFSDSTHPFSAADAPRKNRFQKDYVGIGPGDMLAKERTTGREPPPYQNIKYEDDNVRFLATGERLRQANPSDRIPRMFELSTQRIQRLNVFPDGTPRGGFSADVSQEQIMQARDKEFNSSFGQLLNNLNNLPALLAGQMAAIQGGGGSERAPTEELRSGLKGLFGADAKAIDKLAETVSINSAQQRIAELDNLTKSSDFKKNAKAIAEKLGVTYNPGKQTRDEVKEAFGKKLELIQRLQEDREKAQQLELMNRSRRGSTTSSLGEEKEIPPAALSAAPVSVSAAPVSAPLAATPVETAQNKLKQAVQDFKDDYKLFAEKTQLAPEEMQRLREIAKTVLLDPSTGVVTTSASEIDGMNRKQMVIALNYRINGPPKSTNSPKAPTGPESKFDDAEIDKVIELVKNNKAAGQFGKIAGIIGKEKKYVEDMMATPGGESQIISELNDAKTPSSSNYSTAMQALFNLYKSEIPKPMIDLSSQEYKRTIKSYLNKLSDSDIINGLTEKEVKDELNKFKTNFAEPSDYRTDAAKDWFRAELLLEERLEMFAKKKSRTSTSDKLNIKRIGGIVRADAADLKNKKFLLERRRSV